jgi:hypothetical protein
VLVPYWYQAARLFAAPTTLVVVLTGVAVARMLARIGRPPVSAETASPEIREELESAPGGALSPRARRQP